MHDLTGFQRDCLQAIAKLNNPKGLEIKDELEKEYRDVKHGRLYPNLDVLIEKGFVNKKEISGRTNNYSLQRRGRRELKAYVEELNKAVESMNNEEQINRIQ